MIIMPGSQVFDAKGKKLVVGEYIGQGGFGAVYKATAENDTVTYAIKTLTIPFSDSDELRAFINEGNLALQISHQNVVQYHFFHDGTRYEDLPPYIIMEYAEGGTLTSLIDRAIRDSKPFDAEVLHDMMNQLIDGMESINSILIHRDIKPDNILIAGGTLKVSDFGLAKLVWEATRRMTFKGFGTLPYMAPEAWKFERNTISLDIYAMGMVFYELAALRHPFELNTGDAQKWRDAHLYSHVEPPSVFNPYIPPGLSQVILKMTTKNSNSRPRDWETIKSLMSAANKSTSNVNPLVTGMMKKRIDADSAAEAQRLSAAKAQEEDNDFSKLIISQLKEVVLSPLQEFFEEFNRQYENGKIDTELTQHDSAVTYLVAYPNSKRGSVEFRIVRESDYWREIEFQDYGRVQRRRTLAVPVIANRKVQGFGIVQISGGRGLNIALLEQPGELFGEWFILLNRNNSFSTVQHRQDPFPFSFNEMEEELRYIDVSLHKYVTEVRPFDIAIIQSLLAEAIT